MKLRHILGLALCVSSLWMQAQTEVTTFVPGSTLEGVSYFLPKTAFRITIVTEKTVIKPGDFYKYANRYMRLPNVPTEESQVWSIKSIKLEPFGVPDKNKAYSIKIKSKTVAPLVGLSSDGILLSINTEAEEETLPELPEAIPAAKPEDPRSYMTQEMLTAGSTAKMAELCAEEIYDLRDSRNALIKGEADNMPKDGAQLQLMLNQLDKQISALESMFKGSQLTSTEVTSFNFLTNQETDKEVLFRFSQKLGVLEADDLAGAPVYISVKCTESLPQTVADEDIAKKKAKMDKGVYYNVPVRTKVSVFNNQQEFYAIETPMAQFGVVEILSNILFDKQANTKVTFFQSTGGTKDIMK
ncbi:MAG: DUF4831 family protein [Bacteroidaceae bacterium]|nr:DUF4831 family protein [Bacteroidaceae bacterium]